MTAVKICGITDAAALAAATQHGARMAGFVFHAASPRHVTIDAAAPLVTSCTLQSVGLFVDPDDDTLRRTLATVPLDMIQLHGNETPARVAAVKSLTGLPVIKALRVATRADLDDAASYAPMADWLLFDAKIDGVAGGTGRAFDWSVLDGFQPPRPWLLAGGLNPDNVADAIARTHPDAVDVSSGVESALGVKDPCKIAAFMESVTSCKTT